MHLHRLSIARTLLLVLCTGNVPGASAQTTSPPRDPEAASRAAREADNPMRVIIEASKLKVRIKPEGDGADAASAERRLPRAATRPVVTVPVAKVGAPAAVEASKPASPPATAGEPAVAATVPATLAVPAPTAGVTPAPVLAKAADTMPSALSTPAPILPSAKPQSVSPLPLKLAQLVEPSLPGTVMRRLHNDAEVVVGFTVNADGTVSDVVVRSSPMKALDGPVVEAVSQWRYEPIREARAHTVQMVLRAGP